MVAWNRQNTPDLRSEHGLEHVWPRLEMAYKMAYIERHRQMADYDYLKPVRKAADDLAWRMEVGDMDRAEARDKLLEFAGAILDAVRVEQADAIREANRTAIRDEMARSLLR